MRIPSEALPSFMTVIDARAKNEPPEHRRPEPVDRLADLRPQLNQSSSGERRAAEEEEAMRRAILATNLRNAASQARKERRKADRRKMNQPVFLDTRVTRNRRDDDADTVIDFVV